MIRVEDGQYPEAEDEDANGETHFSRSGPHLICVFVADRDGCVDRVCDEPGAVAKSFEGGGCDGNPVEKLPCQICVHVMLVSTLQILFQVR